MTRPSRGSPGGAPGGKIGRGTPVTSTLAFSLRTLDQPCLIGPGGPVDLRDARALALLVLLRLESGTGVPERDLLLRLTPELTPQSGRKVLDAVIDELHGVLGRPAIRRIGDRVLLSPDAVGVDVGLGSDRQPGVGAAGSRFLRGFALPDTPEFSEWVESMRPRLVAAGDGGTPPVRAKRRIAGILGVFGVAAVALLYLRLVPGAAPSSVAPGTTILLADVENNTGEPVFDRSLTTAAGVSLQQSAQVRLLERSRIVSALSRMQGADRAAPLTLATALEVAEREGVRFVLAPRIAPEGTGYRLSVTLFDVAARSPLAEHSAPAEVAAGVLPALDRVLGGLRGVLGEARRSLRASRPLPLVTTSSLEALRSYAEGITAWEQAEYPLAHDLWLRALDIDTGFAMVMSSLGAWQYVHNNREEGRRYFEGALARAGRLTEWERLRVAQSFVRHRGMNDSAVVLARLIAERFPGGDTWSSYGVALRLGDRCSDAIPVFERALGFDSTNFNVHLGLAHCHQEASRPREALRHYLTSARIDSATVLRGNVAFEFGRLLYALALTDSASGHLTRLLSAPGLYERTLGHRGLAWLAMFDGRPGDAVAHFNAATGISRQQGASLSIARGLMMEGRAHLAAGDSSAARRALDEMAAVARGSRIPPVFLSVFGHSLIVAGRTEAAGEILGLLRRGIDSANQYDFAAEGVLQASLAVAGGEAAHGLSLLEGNRFPMPDLVELLRAAALDRLGRPDSARVVRTRVKREAVFGREVGFDWLNPLSRATSSPR